MKSIKLLAFTVFVLCAACGTEETVQLKNSTQQNQVQAEYSPGDDIPAIAYLKHNEIYNPESVIPAQCYTKTDGDKNPCYVCHQSYQDDKRPNYVRDGKLQGAYDFSDEGMRNSWKNLFKDRSQQIEKISDIVNSGKKYHKDIGPFSSSIASIFLGEYLLAKNNMPELNWPEPSWRLYVLYLRYESKGARNSGKILEAAIYTAKARNMIFFPKENRKDVFTENSPSYFSGRLRFPENIIGDVDCASQIVKDLIPFNKTPTLSSPSSVVKEWILYTISSLLRIYRLYKLK